MTPILQLLLFLLLAAAAASGSAAQALSSAGELTALLSLRSSLGLRARDWPRRVDPCSEWAGVGCGAGGRVTALNLAGLRRSRLGRSDPRFAVDALRNLTSLAVFNASGFPLPGAIPDWFAGAGLPSITTLDLSFCSIVGPIPPGIGGLANLTFLNLSGNAISGAIPGQLFDGLASLAVLDLSRNRLTGTIPPSAPALQNLTALYLFDNFLAGSIPPAVGTMASLVTLDLSNNSFSGSMPPQLGNLSRLARLDLGLNSLSGTLPDELARLSRLRELVLADNAFSGELPRPIWGLAELRFLDLSGNNFTGGLPERPSSIDSDVTTAAEFNLSHNQLFGNVALNGVTGFGFIDLSDNYLEGRVPSGGSGARLNASFANFANNCLQNSTNQRRFQDCESFYVARGLAFDDGSIPPAGAPLAPPRRRRRSRAWRYVLAGVFGGLGFVLILLLVMAFLLRKRRRADRSDQRGIGVDAQAVPSRDDGGGGGGGGGSPSPGIVINLSLPGEGYSYEQLLRATEEFSDKNLIKRGHTGVLYKGTLENGTAIVVKKVEVNLVKGNAYGVELELFGRPSYFRLVPFLGHCLEQDDVKFLVYKYIPNGDLSNAFYRKTRLGEDGLQSLDWITRLKIAIGVAEALCYLHHECNPPLVHRDIQASSILLDDKFEVRLGSLSEICPQEGDAHQNVISRFLRLSQTSNQGPSGSASASCAYDVYCMGKVLLELVTGKLGISGSNDSSMNEWLDQVLPYINVYKRDMFAKIVDPSLIVDEDLLQEVWAMAIVAKSCLNPMPSKRPLTRYVLKALENPLKILREDNNTGGSAKLRTNSSRGSWTAAFFGSWRHSSSDIVAPGPPSMTREGSYLRQVGRTGSQGSGSKSGDFSSSRKRFSREIFPEPANEGKDGEKSDDSNFSPSGRKIS